MASQRHYHVWIKTACPYCVQAQQLLLEKAQTHTLYVMDNESEELDKVKELWNHKTVPLIVLQEGDDEKFIGGYSDLTQWLETGPQTDNP